MCHEVSKTERVLKIIKLGVEVRRPECYVLRITNFNKIHLGFMDILISYNIVQYRVITHTIVTNG